MKELDPSKTYLITGGAGFIGFHLSKSLLEKGARVIGFDNMNEYYDVRLKEDRLAKLYYYDKYTFVKGDLANNADVFQLFQEYRPDIVVNLGAQAGVRYSIDNPSAYMESNMMGFFHILEGCRYFPVEHLVYASSSSVYGGNEKVPFSTEDKVDEPVSLYAATKKYLLDVPVADILRFEQELFEFVDTKYPEIPESIRSQKEIKEDTEQKLIKAIEECKAQFK